MNPIDKWEKLRMEELKEGRYPRICIMGCDDYAAFCGAVQVTLGRTYATFGHADEVIYQGVRLLQSRSKRTGMMFA